MNRLTSQRVNGIKSGYWSAAKKEELVQRLAQYENTGLEPEETQAIGEDKEYRVTGIITGSTMERSNLSGCFPCKKRQAVHIYKECLADPRGYADIHIESRLVSAWRKEQLNDN